VTVEPLIGDVVISEFALAVEIPKQPRILGLEWFSLRTPPYLGP